MFVYDLLGEFMQDYTFYSIVKDIIRTDVFRKMKSYKHHVNGNLFLHSLKVAYLCYMHHKQKKMKIDIVEFV